MSDYSEKWLFFYVSNEYINEILLNAAYRAYMLMNAYAASNKMSLMYSSIKLLH